MPEKADSPRTRAPVRNAALLLAAVLALGLTAPAVQAAPANDARGFVDTIGVNTHLYYTGTVYDNYPLVKNRLLWLGVRHVRDAMDPSKRQFFYDRVNNLGAAGIKSTLINCRFPDSTNWQQFTEEIKLKLRGSIEAAEGVNEPDLQQNGQHDGGAWWNDARECNYWTKEILGRNAWEGPPLDIPTYGASATSNAGKGATFTKLGDLSAIAHGGNMHPYPGSETPSGPGYYSFANVMRDIRSWNFGGRNVPVIATETGYHTAVNHTGGHKPVSERADGIYMPRLFLEYVRAGVQRTFTYELFDLANDPGRSNADANFGLFRNDGTAKPSATAVKNTIGLLDSPSKGPQTPLAYSLASTEDEDGTGSAGAVRDMLFQKADGSWWLALWQDSRAWDPVNRNDISNPANRVDIVLPRTMNVTVYRPTTGAGAVGSGRVRSFYTNVGDDVSLLKLTD